MPPTDSPSQPPMSAESLFDAIGPAYETAFLNVPAQLSSITWIKSQLALLSTTNNKSAKVLDIGCGTGRPVCSSLADAGHDVLGIDISSVMIEYAREKVPNAMFEKMDLDEFSAKSESYDAITVYFSMITGLRQDQIRENIEKIYGWLKPGGIFVFATVGLEGNNVEAEFLGRPNIASGLSTNDTLTWMRKVGFEIVEHTTSHFTPKAAEAGLCKAEDAKGEDQLYIYARKP